MRMRTARFRYRRFNVQVHTVDTKNNSIYALNSTETTTAMTVKVIIKESPAAAQVDRPALGTARKKRQA